MNVYEVTSETINRCNDCRKNINKFNNCYMLVFANNGFKVYLCKECKEKLKNILNAE